MKPFKHGETVMLDQHEHPHKHNGEHEHKHTHIPPTQRSFLNTEAIILGFLLGGLITLRAGMAYLNHEHLLHSPVEETLWTAVYLTFAVGYVQFKYPTFLTRWPRAAVFMLCFVAGVVSLFFDSFAVILLFATLVFLALNGANFRFNAFAVKAIASFNALTVGGGFYLGELWGLPYYISSNMDNVYSGLPLLIVLLPYCALTSMLAALLFPVKVEPVPFDDTQKVRAVQFAAFLILLIVTHSPILGIGVLLLWSAVTGTTPRLIRNGLHELQEGAASALGLILAALVIQQLPGTEQWIAENIRGPQIFALAALSSPFAGAMIPGATSVGEFYQNLTWIMLGAPLLVSSSLVAIVVFREQIKFEDLPRWLQWLPGVTHGGVVQEAYVYTLLMIPLTAGLGVLMYWGNESGIFVAGYEWLHALLG